MIRFSNDELAATLLDLVDQCKCVDSEGQVSFSGTNFPGWRILLEELVCLSPEIPEIERKQIVGDALVESACAGKIDRSSFLQEAKRKQSAYLRRSARRYVMLSTISVENVGRLPGARLNDVVVSFPISPPGPLKRRHSEMESLARSSLLAEPPTAYRWVRVATNARSDDAAAAVCLDALNFVRGVWNFQINLSVGSPMIIGGSRAPLNAIVLGPVHSIHSESGRTIRDVWWYEPDYVGPLTPIDLSRKANDHQEFLRFVRGRLKRIPYRDDVVAMIRQYSNALDCRDWSTSYIKLWQVLESATSANDAKEVVKRSAFVHTDRNLHFAVLNLLREWRHSLVHRGREGNSDIGYYLARLKTYVEESILFHIKFAGDFSSLKEATDFLDCPYSAGEISRRVRVLQKAARFRAG